MTPVKGQLTVLVPQPEVNYSIGGMMPRSDGIVLGHVQQRGIWSLDVDYEEVIRVMESAMRTFATIRPSRPDPPFANRNPFPEAPSTLAFSPPPVNAFFGLES